MGRAIRIVHAAKYDILENILGVNEQVVGKLIVNILGALDTVDERLK
jgi:hypothetical protein